jgi:HEAT repeat protein
MHLALSHPNFMVQIVAIDKLGKIGGGDAFIPLTNLLLNGSYSIRKAAILALVGFGNQAVPYLVQVFDHTSRPKWAANKPTISQYARKALEDIGTPMSLEAGAHWIRPEE